MYPGSTETMDQINNPKSQCKLCLEQIDGEPFVIAAQGGGMAVRNTRLGNRGYHKECAERWISKNEITAKSYGVRVPQMVRDRRDFIREIEGQMEGLKKKHEEAEKLLKWALNSANRELIQDLKNSHIVLVIPRRHSASV
jgi:hypothetical protein